MGADGRKGRRPRRLAPEERDLWNRVAATARPLAGREDGDEAAGASKAAKSRLTRSTALPADPAADGAAGGSAAGNPSGPAADAPGAGGALPNTAPGPGQDRPGGRSPDHSPGTTPGKTPGPRTIRPAPRPTAGSMARYLAPSPEVGPVGRPEAGLDRRTADRLRKGAREPDARIDLHGMRAERAHRACLVFLSDCLARGHRVVLVITGKGRARGDDEIMRSGRGVLRESLPGWLRASPLGHSIVGIYEAHQRHGGAGAFYVYLKRRR